LIEPYVQWEEFEDEANYTYDYMVFFGGDSETSTIYNRIPVTLTRPLNNDGSFELIEDRIKEQRPEFSRVCVLGVHFMGQTPVAKKN
jgi:hypothetical protein